MLAQPFLIRRRRPVKLQQKRAVCLCADARMLVPACFVADAVRRHAIARGSSFDILIFAPPEDIARTHREWAAARGIEFRDDADIRSVGDIPILQSRLSIATVVKLLLPQHLAGRYDTLLYLDADLLIEDDVGALFKLDMGGFAVAAVPSGRLWHDVTERERDERIAHMGALGMTPPYRFFNTGVMLIDVANWNRDDLTRRTLDFLRKHADICYLPDEHALNGVLDGHLLELSPIWNAKPAGWRSVAAEDFHPVIVHYFGAHKPWIRFRKGRSVFQDLDAYRRYRDFVRDTPWPDWLSQQWTARDLRLAVVSQVKRDLRRLFGRARTPSRAERLSWQDDLRRYLAETPYADVEQGIALRQGSGLRLAPVPASRMAEAA